MKRCGGLLLCFLLLYTVIAGAVVSADDSITVRAGIYENSPKIFTGDQGNASGFWPDIIEYIAAEEGWNVEYVHGTWSECLDRLGNNEIDLMPDVAYTEERAGVYAFSGETVLASWSRVYAAEGVEIESVLDLEGKNVAVLKDSVNVEGPDGIKDLIEAFDVECTFIETNSYIEVFELMDSGAAEAGVTNKDFGNQYERAYDVERTPILFLPSHIQFAFTKDAALTPYLIERIDAHMAALRADDDSVYYRSMDDWLGVKPAARQVIPVWLIWALAGIGGVALVLGAGTVILRAHVRARTRDLIKEVAERKQAETALRESEEKYRNLVERANDGVCIIQNGKVEYCNQRLAELWGGTIDEIVGKDFIEFLHPDSLEEVALRYKKRMAGEDVPAIYEAMLKRRDGSGVFVEMNAGIIQFQGEPADMAIIRDITERRRAEEALRQSEERYRSTLDNMLEGCQIIGFDWRYIYVNDAVVRHGRQTRETLLGHTMMEAYPGFEENEIFPVLQRCMKERTVSMIETRFDFPDGSTGWFELSIEPAPEGIFVLSIDITERKLAEEALQRYYRALKVMSLCNQILVRSTNEQELLDEICHAVVGEGGYRMAWVGYAENDEARSVRPVAQCGLEDGYLEKERITWDDTERGLGPTGTAIRTGQVSVISDIPNDPAYAPWRENAVERGYASSIALPLAANGQVFGALNIYASETGAFDRKEIELLTELADDLAFGITALRTRRERDRAEERLSAYLENAPDGVYIASAQDGTILHGNRQAEIISGYQRGDLIGKSFLDLNLIDPDQMGRAVEMLRRNAGGKSTGPDQYEIIRKDGSRVCVEISATPVMEDEHYVVVGVMRDITERQRAAEALRRSEERLNMAVEGTNLGLWDWNVKTGETVFNERWANIAGYTLEELAPVSIDTWTSLAHPDDLKKSDELMEKHFTGERDYYECEVRMKHKKGEWVWVLDRGRVVERDADGQPLRVTGIHLDINERKRAEEALRRSEANLSASQRIAGIGSWERDLVTDASIWSAELFNITGYDPAKPPPSLDEYLEKVHPEDRSLLLNANDRVIENGRVDTFEFRSNPDLGPVRYFLANVERINDAEGCPTALVGTQQDITVRKQAEEAVRQSEEKLRITLNSIPEGVVVTDLEGAIVQVNEAAVRMHGYDNPQELTGRNANEFITKEDLPNAVENYKNVLETGVSSPVEYVFRRKDGVTFPAQLSSAVIRDPGGQPVGFVTISEDISGRKQMEEKLIMTDRLASVGELASGIAHELNNPLTSVIGFSQLLLEREVPQEIRDDLSLMHNEAQRAAQVVKNLLTFARKHVYSKQPVNINDIINKVLQLRAYEHKVNNIEVVTRLAPDLPEISADYFQLQQVFLNIVVNAEFFMIETHRGGRLEIDTEVAGDMIRASFTDDGPGIPRDVIPHLFDPFYTTKEVGKGTGLGLSICHGIVTGHGGRIYVESEPGDGATFVVELPIGGAD